MKKECLAVVIVLIFLGTCLIPSSGQKIEKPSPISRGSWLYVGGSGPGNYTKIQDAIDNASDGDTVFVYSGVYNEQVSINKSINLFGENKSTTIINGQENGCIITLLADNNIVTNFTIKNAGFNGNEDIAGIIVYSSSNQISETIITSDTENAYGVLLVNSSYNIITMNIIHNNYHSGIEVRGGQENSITYNLLFNNSHSSLDFGYSSKNFISENKIKDNICLMLLGSSDNVIVKNIFENKAIAFIFTDSGNNTIKQNNFIKEWKRIIFSFYNIICASEKGTQKNNWDGNYWYHQRIFPKTIFNHLLVDDKRAGISIEIDWHPAQEPYDITGMT
jgi:parallel beta-helix repeat protein